ncbi:hypothetical protein HDV03_003760 [Kappamyces sp. JEL0829]|nr:hypothetical protein HDV03_003760 [Kappamyces sp. JEL0829]
MQLTQLPRELLKDLGEQHLSIRDHCRFRATCRLLHASLDRHPNLHLDPLEESLRVHCQTLSQIPGKQLKFHLHRSSVSLRAFELLTRSRLYYPFLLERADEFLQLALSGAETTTLFIAACSGGKTALVARLLDPQFKTDPNYSQSLGVRLASMKGHSQVVAYLLKHPLSVYSGCIQLLFKEAVERGDVESATILLQDSRLNPSEYDDAAFRTACSRGLLQIVQLLLQNRLVDPTTREHQALIFACKNGHDDVVKALLADSRIDPCHRNSKALLVACQEGHQAVVATLLQVPQLRARPDVLQSAQQMARDMDHYAVLLMLQPLTDSRHHGHE